MASSRLPVFQEKFKELRGDLTQAQFAEKLGLSRPTIGLYESGARIPDAEVLQTIAINCNVSVDYLLGLIEFPAPEVKKRIAYEVTGLSERAFENITAEISMPQALRARMLDEFLSSHDLTLFLDSFADAFITADNTREELSRLSLDGLSEDDLFDKWVELGKRIKDLRYSVFSFSETACDLLKNITGSDDLIEAISGKRSEIDSLLYGRGEEHGGE